MGAGAIGSYLGGMLLQHGAQVTFVGRARGRDDAAAKGLVLEDLDGQKVALAPASVDYATDAAALASCDVVLVALKSTQTEDGATELARVLRAGTLVVSMQNGMGNAQVLRERLTAQKVLGGVVSFNVILLENGTFRRATNGPIVMEHDDDPRLAALAAQLEKAGFQVDVSRDFAAKQWTKLVINSSNALSALSGVPTRALVYEAPYRRIMRAVISEGVRVLRKAGKRTAPLGPLPIRAFPLVLGLPTSLVRIVGRAQLAIDPEARSSMWQDLARGRATEVDFLNGEIARVARSCGARAPLNQRLVELVHDAETAAKGSPNLSASALSSALGL